MELHKPVPLGVIWIIGVSLFTGRKLNEKLSVKKEKTSLASCQKSQQNSESQVIDVGLTGIGSPKCNENKQAQSQCAWKV